MKIRALLVLIVLVVLGAAAFFLRPGNGGRSLLPGSAKSGITQLLTRVPKNAGVFVVLDARERFNLKSELAALKDRLKDNPEVLKTWDDAEKDLGLSADGAAQWIQPAAFFALLPPAGSANLWGTPGSPTPGATSSPPADGKSRVQLASCKSNLRNMATALEMYSTDNAGRYPKSIGLLTPNYLKAIPQCAAAQKDTYSACYQMAAGPDAYTLACQGHHHPQEKRDDFPRYSSYSGIQSDSEVGDSRSQSAAPPAEVAPPEVVFGAPVADEKLALEHLQKLLSKAGPAPREETVGDGRFFAADKNLYVGVYHGFILGANSKRSLEALLATFNGQAENITAHAQFPGMRKKFDIEQGLLAFVPLQGLADALLRESPEQSDAQTQQAVGGLQYAAGSLTYLEGKFVGTGFLAIDAQSQSGFIKALLAPPAGPLQSADLFPLEWGNYSALDLRYLLTAVIEGLKASPGTRSQTEQGLAQIDSSLGVSLEKDIWGAFSGEVAWSSNLLKILPNMMKGNFTRARGQGQLTACKSNLKNVATSLEMYSCDNQGHYPANLTLLTPNYLRVIPQCPASGRETYSQGYRSATTPDAYTVFCQGQSHGQANFPQYNSFTGLQAGTTKDEVADTDKAQGASMPTYVVALGVKDPAKAEQLLSKLTGLVGPGKPTDKVGDVQPLEYPLPNDLKKVVRCATVKPATILVAVGPDAQQMLTEVLQVKKSVSSSSAFQSAWKDQPQRWVHASYLDITPFMQSLKKFLADMPDNQDNAKMISQLLDTVKDGEGVSYLSVDVDGLRGVSRGNATLAGGGMAVVAAILVPNFVRARSQGQLTACKSNQKNIATSLEMYSCDNQGHYPPNLTLLTPSYLKTIPRCPAANGDTYSQTYQFGKVPDAYTFFCQGAHHGAAGIGENFPQYSSYRGLLTNP